MSDVMIYNSLPPIPTPTPIVTVFNEEQRVARRDRKRLKLKEFMSFLLAGRSSKAVKLTLHPGRIQMVFNPVK
jgi:hypothetical protein